MTTNKLNMSYASFCTTYAWMLKNYPGTDRVYRAGGFYTEPIGTVTELRYERSSSRGRWRLVKSSTEPLTGAYYSNSVDAIPFFRRLGGREHVSLGYTKLAYLPIEIVSTSPDKLQKTIRSFDFD